MFPATDSSTAPQAQTADALASLLIISGNGDLPRLVAEGAREARVRHISVLGIRGSTDRATYRAADSSDRVTFGDLDGFRAKIKASGAKHAILAGGLNAFILFNPRAAAFIYRELAKSGEKHTNSHTIFARLVALIEECGVSVLPTTMFLRHHIPAAGVLTRRQPTEQENTDLALAAKIASAVANLEIGQTALVKNGAILTVEGLDGTNAAFKRGGKIGKHRDVSAVKVAKDDHDMRFDIPAVGTGTIAAMRRNGISALGVHAGRAIFINLPEVVRAADEAGIALVALANDLQPAPFF